ncbi:rhodanese-like domain-containing protein, partial [Rivihabitans pingtungensis]
MSWLRISASEALTLLAQDDATVFDVRDSAAYQAGHLAKAANLAM